MRHIAKSVILGLGPITPELFGMVFTSAGVNMLTADKPNIHSGLGLLIGGACLFIVGRAVGDLFADARWRPRQPDDTSAEVLSLCFAEHFRRRDPKFALLLVGILLAGFGIFWHIYAFHVRSPEVSKSTVVAEVGRDSIRKAATVRVSTSKNLWCALTLVALDQRLFEREGLEVQPVYQLAGRQNMDALVSKSAEIANVVEVNHAYQALNGNRDLSIIGSIVSARDFALVAKRQSGIVRATDLPGRRLAFAPGTGAEMFVFALLQQNRIDPKSVELKRVQPAGLIDAIASPDIDVAASWEPFVSSMKARLGNSAVEVDTGTPYVGVMNVAVRRDWLAKNRDTAVRLLRALRRSEELVRQRPDDAQEILARAAGLDRALVRNIWGRFSFALSLDRDSQEPLLKFVLNTIIANEPEYARQKTPEISSYFDTSVLQEVINH